MNNLKGLIRLSKWRLDEKRRELADLQSLGQRLVEQVMQLEAELLAEQEVARGTFEVSFGYARYAAAAIGRRQRLAQSIAQVQAQVAVATDEIAEAFQELKRYELAQSERERQDKEKLRRRENNMLDEVAVAGFLRRRREEDSAGR